MRIPDTDDTVYSSATGPLVTQAEPGGTPSSTAVWINPDFMPPVTAYKNLFINPMFDVNQRNSGAVTTINGYPADRWWVSFGTSTTMTSSRGFTGGEAGGGGTRTAQASMDMPPTRRELAYDVTAVGDGTNGSAYFGQDVEWTGLNTKVRTVTISFWAKDAQSTAPQGKMIGIEYTPMDAGTGIANYTAGRILGVSSAWKRYSLTFNIAPFTASVPVIRFRFWLSAGTALMARSGIAPQTWVGRFSCFQLELGPIMTEFEQRPYALELELCQRWYWRFVSSNSPEGITQPYRRVGIGAHHPTSNSGVAYMPFPTTMFRPPTTWAGGGTNAWTWWLIGNGTGYIGYDNVSVDGVNWYQNTVGTSQTGMATMLYIGNANDTYAGMSAEYVN